MKILANEFVLPLKAGRSCHASSFIVLPNGGIYAVYFCGTGEGHDDVRIFGSMREPGVVGHWSEPTPITPDDGIPLWNPVLLPLDDGTVILYYKVGKRIPTWQTYYCVSTDGCKTWSELRRGDFSSRFDRTGRLAVLLRPFVRQRQNVGMLGRRSDSGRLRFPARHHPADNLGGQNRRSRPSAFLGRLYLPHRFV